MNEQEMADLFSQQLDRMLQGEPATVPPHSGDLQELLNIVGQPASQTQFQAGSAAQAAFQSQLAGWFGLANGGSTMTILGLPKLWLITIFTAVTLIVGGGLIAVIATTSIFVLGPVVVAPAPTDQPTDEPTDQPTEQPTDQPTEQPTEEATVEPTEEPDDNPLPTLIFINNIVAIQLCQGAYGTQSALVNYPNRPVNNAALGWEVIEGANLVDNVNITSPQLQQAFNETNILAANTPPATVADLNSISINQKIKLDIKVKVKDNWWGQPDGTKIKVKLWIKNKIKLNQNGPGNRSSQIVTIVKQSAQWVSLTGPVRGQGQNLVVDGVRVSTNPCSNLPPNLNPGSIVNVIGLLQPNGTVMVINLNIVNINIITGNFDSGVPLPGGGDDNDDGDGKNGGDGGGGSRGGSHGGSRGGS